MFQTSEMTEILAKARPFLSIFKDMGIQVPIKNLKSGLDIELFKIAGDYLGIHFTKLQDKEQLRFFISSTFNPRVVSHLNDDMGMICFTLEHGALFSYRALYEGYSEKLVMGYMLAISAHAISEDIQQLKANSTKGRVKSGFLADINNLHLKGVKNFQRGYMKSFLLEEGEEGYYLENKYLATISYLVSKGWSFQKAKKFLHDNSGIGLFYSWLPLEVEDRLAPYILSGKLDTALMDGYLAPSLLDDMLLLEKNNLVNMSLYSRYCKPIMLAMMGIIISDLKKEMTENGLTFQTIVPYYASERCLAIKVKGSYDLKTLLSTMHVHFQKVKDLTVTDLCKGFWV